MTMLLGCVGSSNDCWLLHLSSAALHKLLYLKFERQDFDRIVIPLIFDGTINHWSILPLRQRSLVHRGIRNVLAVLYCRFLDTLCIPFQKNCLASATQLLSAYAYNWRIICCLICATIKVKVTWGVFIIVLFPVSEYTCWFSERANSEHPSLNFILLVAYTGYMICGGTYFRINTCWISLGHLEGYSPSP